MRSIWTVLARNTALAILSLTIAARVQADSTEKVLHDFGGPGDGYEPWAGLVSDGNGNLYGVTAYGGLPCHGGMGCGIVFQLTSQPDGSWNEHILHYFQGDDGQTPNSPPVFDQRGNLYGTTELSPGGFGTVFQLKPVSGTWTLSTLHNFSGAWDGAYPHGVALDPAGHLYGSTSFGLSRYAVVFSLTPLSIQNWYELVLHAFSVYNTGGDPVGILSFDPQGNVYGTTVDGGANNSGIVFELVRNKQILGWTFHVLYSFQGTPYGSGMDGANPYAGVIPDADGNLYGTTEWGGTAGMGTVFKLTHNPNDTWTESIIYQFQGGSDGGHPRAALTMDALGNLYGTTQGGGAGASNGTGPGSQGTVFRLTSGSGGQWAESVLYAFSGGLDGSSPESQLIMDSVGNLYGTTVYGGQYDGGVAFEITP